MNSPEQKNPGAASPDADPDDRPSQGPNLILLYGLVVLALAAAIGFALMIVLPFYQRR